ncbi:hypothetical protein KUV28_00575 [Ferrimonas balearica]|nr:hypothetical protein [Ferrimonas balearica]
MTEITRKTRLCSSSGGILDIRSDETGEVLGEIAVPAGAVMAAQYMSLIPEGAHLEIASGLAAINPRHRIGIQPHPLAREIGANPEFQPTSASRFEREMRLQLARMKALNDGAERRQRKLAEIERIPTAPKEDPDPVVEPTPSPAPEPKQQPATELKPEGGNE